MTVPVALAPLIVIFPLRSRSPVALASSLAPGIVSVNVPAGTMIELEPPWASAAMMADRSEIWPDESLPFCRLTATVSRVVLTRNVESCSRCSSASRTGSLRVVFRFAL